MEVLLFWQGNNTSRTNISFLEYIYNIQKMTDIVISIYCEIREGLIINGEKSNDENRETYCLIS